MKTIITQFRVAAKLNINDKREFVIKQITDKLFNLRDKEAFIENTASRLRELEESKELDNVLNGVLGYLIFLLEQNSYNVWETWLYESLHDIALFIKDQKSKVIKQVFRIRMFKSYIKELKMERV